MFSGLHRGEHGTRASIDGPRADPMRTVNACGKVNCRRLNEVKLGKPAPSSYLRRSSGKSSSFRARKGAPSFGTCSLALTKSVQHKGCCWTLVKSGIRIRTGDRVGDLEG